MSKKKLTEKPSVEPAKPYPKIIDTRLNQLHYTLEFNKVEALAITYLPNIRYLTNFSGSSATLFVTYNDIIFITDDRYEEQIKDELYQLPNLKTFITRDVWNFIKQKKLLKGVATIAFEADRVYYSDAVNIRNIIRPIKFKPVVDLVERFTIRKSPEELENIKKAGEIAEKVYKEVLEIIKPGITEREIAIEIAHRTRLYGSESDPFPIIVNSGPRGAIVHGTPTNRKIKNGDLIIMDFGCKINGFCSDITRTIAVGKATKEQKNLYNIIYQAKEKAIKEMKANMNGKNIDALARNVINEAGYGEYFQHSLGHGIGIMPHEMPTITFRLDDQIVPEDCVITIEPGVYLPNKYGIRIEDMVFVSKNGAQKLTEAPSELVII